MTKWHWILIALLLIVIAGLSPESTHAQTFGTNWTGQFYNTTTFTGSMVAIASYPNGLSFNWPGQPTDGNGLTLPGVNADNFSARFATSENFTQTGVYRFFGTVDDQIRVYLDGVEIYSSLQPGAFSFERSVTAGTHTLRVDFVELLGAAILQFQWQLGGTTVTATPAAPQIIGQVVNVTGLSLRTGPYLGASRIGVLKPGIAYPVLGRSNDEGGWYTWYLVQAGEQTGWTSGRYLTVNGDVPERTSVFQEIDNAPDVGAIAIPRAFMNLRHRPSIRSAKIDQVPWGAEVTLIGRTIQGGSLYWLQVIYNGKVGWIYAPYVTVRGNIDGVPIR